jgi:hypothetical protein
MRDMAIAKKLHGLADATVDWLVPDPAREFMLSRGYRVLDCSARLLGSGRSYAQVFADCADEFNLIRYILAETRLHKHDFFVSSRAWEECSYDVIVGDEAFWLLTGFNSHWKPKPAPFIFITDFIATKAMRPRVRDVFVAWYNNFKFTMSHMAPDQFLYIGDAQEIPDERLGFALPRRRAWAERHCRFVRPIVDFDPEDLPGKRALRQQLGLPEGDALFLATVGPEGEYEERVASMEAVFELLRAEIPNAHFILVCPGGGAKTWIRYEDHLDRLHEYFAASDFVITQSGYGKVIELSAVGTPFIAIPLDHHFEQEHFMGHRMAHHGLGTLVRLRDHSPESIAEMVLQSMTKVSPRLVVDDGAEVARIILEAAEGNLVDDVG